MKAFLDVVDKIKETLEETPFVNTVTYGDPFEVGLDKAEVYPIAHYIVSNAIHQDRTIDFEVAIQNLGLPKNGEKDNYVLAEQLSVIKKLLERAKRGDLWGDLYQLEGVPTSFPIYNMYIEGSTGWETTFVVRVPNIMPIDDERGS